MYSLFYLLYHIHESILKAIPNKNAGFIILLTSIIILFYFGEIKNLLILLFIIKNYLYQFYSYILLIIFIIFIYIGTQSPHIIYITYTLYTYILYIHIFILFIILLSGT